MRSTLRVVLGFAAIAAGCSSLGGVELGDGGPDRFPDYDDGPSSATADPTHDGNEPADPGDTGQTDPGDSDPSGPPGSISGPAGTEGGEASSSDGGEVGTGAGETTDGGSETSVGPGEDLTAGDDASSDTGDTGAASEPDAGDGCPEVALPPCPPPCAFEGALPCGSPCNDVADGFVCSDPLGALATCEAGLWSCTDAPRPGDCTRCDPDA